MARPFPSGAGSDKNGVGAIKGQQSPADPGRGQGWLLPIVLFVVVLGIYLLTVAHDWLSLDVWSAHFGAWSIATTGSPSVDGAAMPPLEDTPLREQFVRESVNGHLAITRVPASSLPGSRLLAARRGDVHALAGGVTAALLTAVSVVLVFRTLESRLPRRTAALAAAAFAVTTPVWSVAADGIWPHTLTILGITGMAWASSTRRWWLVGSSAESRCWAVSTCGHRRDSGTPRGLGATRSTDRPTGRGRQRSLRGRPLCLELLGLWHVEPVSGVRDLDVRRVRPEQGIRAGAQPAGHVVRPRPRTLRLDTGACGAAPALVRSWRNLPDWSRALVWGGLAYSVLQCLLDDYDGGYGFYGYRLGLEMLACITPAVALSAPRAGRLARRLIGPALAVQLCAIAMVPLPTPPPCCDPATAGTRPLSDDDRRHGPSRVGTDPRRHAARRLGQPSVGRSHPAEPSRAEHTRRALARQGRLVGVDVVRMRTDIQLRIWGRLGPRRSYASSLGIVISGTSSWATQDAIGDVR